MSTSIAERLQRTGGTGQVDSVFTHALNLRDTAGLLTVADPGVGAVPNGVVLTDLVDFEALGIRPGDTLTIDFAHAVPWSPRLPNLIDDVVAHVVLGAWRLALERTRARIGLPDVAPIERLAQACRRHDLSAMLEASRGLIGLGQGLTPSGDDVLVGFSAGLWSTGDPEAERFSAACAEYAASRTTDVALEFYRSAARGEFSAGLHRLLAAIGAATHAKQLSLAFEDAFGWGATSGADTALGVLVGLIPGHSSYLSS